MRAVCGGCMNRCVLEEGQTGLCRARKNTGGAVVPVNYGKITSMALEKAAQTVPARLCNIVRGKLWVQSEMPLLPES